MTDFFSDSFLSQQKSRLLNQKMQILGRFHHAEDLKSPSEELSDEVDMGQMILDQNFAIGLRERDLRLLKDIELSLKKLDEGIYGLCEESGRPIEKKRLERLPWARLSLQCAEEEERRHRIFQIYN